MSSPPCDPPPPAPFALTRTFATPHGIASLVALPDDPAPVPDAVVARLPSAEAAHARALGGYRQVSFVGGRLALHAAMQAAGTPDAAVLPDARGTPVLPEGWTGSVSHKRRLAVGMVARAGAGTLGVDLECRTPARLRVASKVLRPAELEAIAPLPEDRRWIALLMRFSMKEAIYKAVDPYVRRWVGFDEAEVWPDRQGRARITLHLSPDRPGLVAHGRVRWIPGHVLTTVRILDTADR